MTEYTSVADVKEESGETNLRNVDLNLLTVFDAVMQMQNVTRAAELLGMSQPAVSNAVSRLKVMFNDELFVRYGRGIQPTARAKQLFGPVRQALQLVHNELPGAGFDPATSERTFNLSISSPLDIRLTDKIIEQVKQHSKKININIQSYMSKNIEHDLKYQETDFAISYNRFDKPNYNHHLLFNDQLSLVAARHHPRVQYSISEKQIFTEQHAVVALDLIDSFSAPYYENNELLRAIVYQGTNLISVLNIVSKTELVAIAPKWLIQLYSSLLPIQEVQLPWDKVSRPAFLIWHEACARDKGHQWMKALLSQFTHSI
ncbi:transcriptional regulator LeuO [Morganella psychrotolerans]|uniref:Transcriptional regulator LeuO n=1 Tax=Morganella psychrotolerans TaxID=368603 RepID=A0A5M9RAC4_9GAMM|nr:transcriptional regulator LeuO [Morganella psychrotolerans]KAA8717914.1 transcriptional regulator LeuO [Morganella psychrotolerans]OBU07863.1 transcriptional regulator LeuO [Morganella psychrotolerans]HCM63455.1 transcriptional regulator LeuO [Morganella sp. (in: enterobacteria)]